MDVGFPGALPNANSKIKALSKNEWTQIFPKFYSAPTIVRVAILIQRSFFNRKGR